MNNIIPTVEQTAILNEMHYGKTNLDIQGKAGVGKSLIIKEFQASCINRLVCLAPTGIAAQNINGATLHSFFKLPFGIIDPKQLTIDSERQLTMLRTVDTILLDESSMIRSDVFGAMDYLLRLANDPSLPFGGKRIITIGDVFQLPPIVPGEELVTYLESLYGGIYYFCSKAFRMGNFKHMLLHQPHRQRDPRFVEFLDAVRYCGRKLSTLLDIYNPELVRAGYYTYPEAEHAICLCCTRHDADMINQAELSKLPDPGVILKGRIDGKFPLDELPTDLNLVLKRDAKVMILINQANLTIGGYNFVNGATGTIVGYDISIPTVTVRLANGTVVTLREHCWPNYEYDITYGDRGSIELIRHEVGMFWQLPILSADAITIHKSQGQTLDKAHLVLGGGCFASGQLYTALSRVRCIDDLSIDRPISIFEAFIDPQVLDYYYPLCPDIF